MIIRKSFNIINTHIVRNCSSTRCKQNTHAHTYELEVYLESDKLDNGMMVVDFGLVKNTLKTFIKAFNQSYSFWSKESDEYKQSVKDLTKRWVQMPVSPSAEAYSLFFTYWFDKIISNTQFNNGEGNIRLHKVRVHETRTGWSETYTSELTNPNFSSLKLDELYFPDEFVEAKEMLSQINKKILFINPVVTQQV